LGSGIRIDFTPVRFYDLEKKMEVICGRNQGQ